MATASVSEIVAMLVSMSKYGGYDYCFVDKELDKFTCSICNLVFRDPHLTGCCGQHFCESCLKNWFTKHRRGKENCPHCRAEGKKFQHILNKSLKREIDSLKIHCTKKKEGCQWIGELGSLKDHLELDDGCGYVEVDCPNRCKVPVIGHKYESEYYDSECDDILNNWLGNVKVKKMQRNALAAHLKNECYLRFHRCEHCGYNDTYVAITGHHPYHSVRSKTHHYTKCLEFPLECPNKCGAKVIKRKNMKDHRNKCPREPVQCPFEEAGCKEKLVRRELEQHMSATQQQHLLMVMGAYKEMKRENYRIRDKLEDTQDELDDLKRKLNRKRKRTDYDSDDDMSDWSDL